MLKIINKFLNFILWILVPYLLASLATKHFGIEMGLGVVILTFVALFLKFKATIFTLIAARKFDSNHDEGFRWYQKAYDTGKMNAQQSLIYAYLLIRDGHIDKAHRLINSVTSQKKDKLTPSNIQASELNLALIYWKKGDLSGAIELMEKIGSEGYRSTVYYGNLGLFYILNNQLEKAEKITLEALEFNPSDAGIRDNLGYIYYKKGEIDKALEVYEKLFEDTSPTFTEAFYNYGLVLEAKGDFDGASQQYLKARSCPERYLSPVKLGHIDMALSRVEEKKVL